MSDDTFGFNVDHAKHEQERKDQAKRLEEAYATAFRTTHGMSALKDLMTRYGFDENGIERPTVRHDCKFKDAARIDGAKEVVRHILSMSGFKIMFDQPQPTTKDKT